MSDENARSGLSAQTGLEHGLDLPWGNVAGSLATVQSLLAFEAARTPDCEMTEWYLAVLEEMRHEAGCAGHALTPFEGELAEELLAEIATRIYLARR